MCQHYFFLRHAAIKTHGTLLGQSLDASLSPEGQAQTKKWGSILKDIPLQAVICSPARRTQETAEGLGLSGVPIVQLPHLQEINWGEWEGKPLSEASTLLQIQSQLWAQGDLDWAPPKGESLRAVLHRIEEAMRLMAQWYPAGNLLIITHGQLLRVLLTHLLGYPLAELHRFRHERGHLSWLIKLPDGFFYLRTLAADADSAF
ncbi:MAG: histidine phosphatase family protein [Bacteroidia bacterium]|nr:histidine phosphatase family protein [Bacteroidia bacterium]